MYERESDRENTGAEDEEKRLVDNPAGCTGNCSIEYFQE
jgi:hypothetical protein